MQMLGQGTTGVWQLSSSNSSIFPTHWENQDQGGVQSTQETQEAEHQKSRVWGPGTAGQARVPPSPQCHAHTPTGAWGPWASCQESAAILPVSVQQKAHALQRPSLFPKPQLPRILRPMGRPGLPVGNLKKRLLAQILHTERG